MAAAVVFAFAVADGLAPVVGAAPYEVLARQLPRLLVVRLNAGGDRGVRFFPFLGTVDGRREFLVFRSLLEPAKLAELHRQGETRFLCDGMLQNGVLRWRVVDGTSLRVLHDIELPFDARRPGDVLARLEFELMGLLGFAGRPHESLGAEGELLGWLLILKDAVLRREAGMADETGDPLRAARRCAALAPNNAEIAEVGMDLIAHVLRCGPPPNGTAELLRTFADANELPPARQERLAGLLLAVHEENLATTVILRVARALVERVDLVERAVALAFRQQRCEEAGELVELARARGVASVTALAQYAACCDRIGDHGKRAELCDVMLREHDLPLPVARLLVSFLLEDERAGDARDVADRALDKDPAQPVLHFERGRALLSLDETERAVAALEEAIARGLPEAMVPRARRLMRLARAPGLWRGTQKVEIAMARGDLGRAFRDGVALLRCGRRIAEAWFLIGVVCHKLGDGTRAQRALRRALALDDSLADAHNRLGILLVAEGRVEAGVVHLQRARELAPAEPSPMLHLAQALALLGRGNEAQALVERAAEAGADAALVEAVRREIHAPRR
ncbi:MAG: hypothetical protein U1E73_06520 [Planctomycetota bacterium]